MRGRGPMQALAASPTMVGAITTLIVIVAVFLAYNANQGLPFVPVYRVAVDVPNAARLTNNNEVRIGGHRVGAVESIEAIRAPQGEEVQSQAAATDRQLGAGGPPEQVIARLNLKLDQAAKPLPRDSRFRVRYRSSFGLKYLEINRGDGPPAPEGYVFPVDQTTEQTEFDDINNTFDAETRENSRTNLEGFGNAFAARGTSLNQAIEALNPLLRDLGPASRALLARSSPPALRRLFPELGDAARIVAPVAAEQAELFGNMAVAFGAISEDPEALRDTISEGVPTLETGIATLPRQRPFLRDFTTLSRLLEPGVEDLRVALPRLNRAIDVGTPVLRRTPTMNRDLRRVFVELEDLVERPTTKLSLERLEALFDEAKPLAGYVAPAQTVCNYWNYWFTFLPEHLTERDQVGFTQRVMPVTAPPGEAKVGVGPLNLTIPGEVQGSIAGYSGIAANGRAGSVPDPSAAGEFKPYEIPILHDDPYGPTGQHNADCQAGQTGYALGQLLQAGQPVSSPGAFRSDLPGSRGPTTAFYRQDGSNTYVDTRVPGRQP